MKLSFSTFSSYLHLWFQIYEVWLTTVSLNIKENLPFSNKIGVIQDSNCGLLFYIYSKDIIYFLIDGKKFSMQMILASSSENRTSKY